MLNLTFPYLREYILDTRGITHQKKNGYKGNHKHNFFSTFGLTHFWNGEVHTKILGNVAFFSSPKIFVCFGLKSTDNGLEPINNVA